MNDDDLKALFRQNTANWSAPELPIVLAHKPRRYKSKPIFMVVVMLVAVAATLPFLWPTEQIERPSAPMGGAVNIPTTDWLLAVPETGKSRAMSQ